MGNIPINLLAPFVSETKAATGKASGSVGSGSGSFLDLLSRIARNGSASIASGIEEEEGSLSCCMADDLPSSLLDSDVQGLLSMIEAMVGGATVKEGDASEPAAQAVGTDSAGTSAAPEQTPDKEVQTLVLGLLASLMARNQATTSSSGNGELSGDVYSVSDILQGLALGVGKDKAEGAAESVPETVPETASSSSESSDTPLTTDEQGTLEMLALILFSSLQALQEKQGQTDSSPVTGQEQPPATGGTDGLAAAIDAGTSRKQALDSALARTGSTGEGQPDQDSRKEIVQEKPLQGFLEDITGSDEGETVSGDKTAAGPEIVLTPSSKEGSRNLTLTISGAFRNFDQNGQQGQAVVEAAGSTGAGGSAQEESNTSAVVTTVVEDLSPLLENKNEDSRNDAGTGEKPSRGQESQFMAGNDVSRAASQETREKATTQAPSTGAVERFERVLDQFATRASNHDLTMRLDIGNKESLLLGFKNMGESIAVEVKASHQAITDLLQNQKDVIVKHLESKDVHATIQIDPDSSATTDRRERRETRDLRQRFAGAAQEDSDFGEYLEVFA